MSKAERVRQVSKLTTCTRHSSEPMHIKYAQPPLEQKHSYLGIAPHGQLPHMRHIHKLDSLQRMRLQHRTLLHRLCMHWGHREGLHCRRWAHRLGEMRLHIRQCRMVRRLLRRPEPQRPLLWVYERYLDEIKLVLCSKLVLTNSTPELKTLL